MRKTTNNDTKLDGFLTTKQAINWLNANHEFRKPVIASRWDYLTRSRAIEPDGSVGACKLWSIAKVQQIAEIMLAEDLRRSQIIAPPYRRQSN